MISTLPTDAKASTWRQLVKICRPYFTSEVKGQALALLAVLLALLVAVNGLNVAINYVSGRFMTALSSKDQPTFYHMLALYFSVFVVGTPIVVFYSWVTEKLGLHWRQWLTQDMIRKYLKNRSYYHINNESSVDNPDERIAQDVRDFTHTALTLLLNVLSSVVTLFAFIFILWSISHKLVAIVFAYSISGTIATLWMGRRLVKLKFDQLKKEADFRYSLVHVRNNVESIAFYRGEQHELKGMKGRFMEAVANFDMLIGWQRNLGFLTTGYNYLVALIPALIIAPLYFQGKVPFGTETQADMAFAQILSALSLLITSIDDVTAFGAQIKRLGSFYDSLVEVRVPRKSAISTVEADRIELKQVTLLTPNQKQMLVSDLSLTVEPGHNLLIMGASGLGKSSLLRAIAGLWEDGSGQIERPPLDQIMFLPQRPYMVLGTLRDQLLYPHVGRIVPDDQLQDALKAVNLPDLVERVGGLNACPSWTDVLSPGEEQRLAFARLFLTKPRFAILDEATSALDTKNEELLYRLLQELGTTYLSVGHRPTLIRYHGQALELTSGSTWQLMALDAPLAA